MAQYSDDLHAAAQMLDCILEAAKNFAAKPIAGDPNDEQVISGPSLKMSSDGEPVRQTSPENRGERTLLRASIPALHKPEILQIDIDNALGSAVIVRQSVEQGRESQISCFEARLRRIQIRRPRPRILRAIAVCDSQRSS